MNKVGIVTGGTKGIGLKVVEQQLNLGNKVIATYHSDDEAANKMKSDLERFSKNIEVIKIDASNEDDQKEFSKYVKKKYGRIDFLVNNAGISISDFSLYLDFNSWKKVLSTNLDGVFLSIKHIVPLMLNSNNASIVNISSQVGLTGNHGQIAYSTSKSGINGITRTLAQEVGKKNIRVNSVAPGFIATEILNEMSHEEKDYKKQNILLGRFGTPEEIANVISFLISDKSSFINSSVLEVDGGRKF